MKHLVYFIAVILLIIFAIFLNSGLNNAFNEYSEISNKYKSYIGSSIVINSDTLMITDYSIFNENFKLSNGSSISIHLLDSTKLIKNENN